IGSTSQFEPHHSRSYWNYTPLGFQALVEDGGLQVEELRPGIEGLTLVRRPFLDRQTWFYNGVAAARPLQRRVDDGGPRTAADDGGRPHGQSPEDAVGGAVLVPRATTRVSLRAARRANDGFVRAVAAVAVRVRSRATSRSHAAARSGSRSVPTPVCSSSATRS